MTGGWGVGRGSWVAVVVMLAAPTAMAQQLHGFSIVLVQGDMVATTKQSDLPEQAQRAIGDMKGLLPFRSYHLVDSAWVLANSASGLINARLTGPDGVDYTVVMEVLPATGGTQRVAFRLRESGGEPQPQAMDRDLETLNRIVASLRQKYEDALIAQRIEARLTSGEKNEAAGTATFLRSQLAEAERRLAETRGRIALERDRRAPESRTEVVHRQVEGERQLLRRLEAELEAASQKYLPNHPDMVARRSQTETARARLESLLVSEAELGRGTFAGRGHAPAGATLIETMFTMRVGETVVVGTSRTGVDKALVAVLTAAPSPARKF